MRHTRIVSIILCVVLLMSILPLNCFASEWTYDQFANYLMNTYNSTTDKLDRPANYNTYLNYNQLIVFGSPTDVPNNDSSYSSQTNRMEYRYLGYQFDGITKITNTYFPADAWSGAGPDGWTYLPNSSYPASWNAIKDTDQLNYMLSTPLSYSGTQYNVTVNSIGGTDYALLQSAATWKSGFSVYTQHMSGGSCGMPH